METNIDHLEENFSLGKEGKKEAIYGNSEVYAIRYDTWAKFSLYIYI